MTVAIDRPVHPAAAVFPMLSEDDLADLAEDIKANGLLHPIRLDQEGRIVDGRNRNAACALAGVEPTYETLPAEADIVAYVRTENRRRRHMSQGQLAMADALLLDIDGGRTGAARDLSFDSKLSKGQISKGVQIRKYAPELVAGVLAGTEPFDKAYATAVARKKAREDETEAGTRKTHQDRVRLERLTRSHPDIAALVPDRLTLDAAEAAAAEESRRRAAEVEAQSRLMETVLNALDPGSRATPGEKAGVIAGRLDATSLAVRPDFTPQRIARARDTLAALVVLLEAQEVLDARTLESIQR